MKLSGIVRVLIGKMLSTKNLIWKYTEGKFSKFKYATKIQFKKFILAQISYIFLLYDFF